MSPLRKDRVEMTTRERIFAIFCAGLILAGLLILGWVAVTTSVEPQKEYLNQAWS